MAWVRLDDGFADHPKILRAGPLALALQVRAFCYASRHETDGFIPLEALPHLVNGLGDALKASAQAKAWAAAMVESGLWEQSENGYIIHDFLDYNPSKAERKRIRTMKQRAGKKGGILSAQARAQAPALAAADISPSPSPSPNTNTLPGGSLRDTARTVLSFLNERTGKSFRPTDPNLRLIEARLKYGTSADDCRRVIEAKVREWRGDAKMARFLRPATLFDATKFEQYLGALAPNDGKGSGGQNACTACGHSRLLHAPDGSSCYAASCDCQGFSSEATTADLCSTTPTKGRGSMSLGGEEQ